MNATEILAKLKTLARQGGERTFERVGLAAKLLADREWLAGEVYKGDEGLAREAIQADYFGDLCGALTLGQLLEIRERFPQLSMWQEKKFNLQRLWQEVVEARKKERDAERAERCVPERKNPIANEVHEEVKRERDSFQKLYQGEKESHVRDIESRDDELRRVRGELNDLRLENAKLKGRIEQLERNSRREMAVA